MASFVTSIPSTSTLYLSLAGHNVSRHGDIFIVIILVHPLTHIVLIDFLELGAAVFNTAGRGGRTLKVILEEENILKAFWDIRPDADALWALCDVKLNFVIDLQLLENVTRPTDRTYLHDLNPCLLRDFDIDIGESIDDLGAAQFMSRSDPATVFAKRPLEPETVLCCVNKVFHLPALHIFYGDRIGPQWPSWVVWASIRRVHDAQKSGYDPESPTDMVSPWCDSSGGGSWTFGDHVEATQDLWMDVREGMAMSSAVEESPVDVEEYHQFEYQDIASGSD
ncbi:hypothetical protein ACHAQH_003824 [Verticillium albo-atrum]